VELYVVEDPQPVPPAALGPMQKGSALQLEGGVSTSQAAQPGMGSIPEAKDSHHGRAPQWSQGVAQEGHGKSETGQRTRHFLQLLHLNSVDPWTHTDAEESRELFPIHLCAA
jgi:hypothetical protein